jgi:DNA polymerase-3 subunit delta
MEPGASVFDLTAAIGARDRSRMLIILTRNLEAGEAPLRILGSLVWQYRQLWKAKEAVRLGGSEGEAARMLRMPPFKVRGFLGQFSDAHLRFAFGLFLETDSKLKGGSAGTAGRVLEAALLALTMEQREPGEPKPGGTKPSPQPTGAGSRGTRPVSNVRTVRPGRPTAR